MNRRRLAGLAVVAVLLVLFGGRWLALRFTEHAWFDSLGQGSRFWLLLLRASAWQVVTFLAFSLWYAAHAYGVYRSIGSVQLPRRLGNLEIAEAVPHRILRRIAVGVGVILGLASAYTFGDLDHYVSLYRHAAPLLIQDPVLQRDAVFYLARLPLLEVLHLAAILGVVLATGMVTGLYLLTGSMTLERRRLRVTPHARTHLVMLLCMLALVLAWGFHLDGFQLVGGGGSLDGALSPVDRAIRLPAANALAVIALVVAAASALALRWIRPGSLFGVWATLGIAVVLGRLVVPLLAEAWGPANTPALSRMLNQQADAASRVGAGLGDQTVRSFEPAGEIRPESLQALADALVRTSPWSGELAMLEAALEADAAPGDSARPRTWSVSLGAERDREGRLRLVAVGVPQVDPLAAARHVPRARWSELHRGPGAWAGAPLAVDAGLRSGPLLYLSGLSPAETTSGRASLPLGPAPLRIVPRQADLGIVGPDEVLVGETPPGVRLRSFPRRLLLAWALQSPPLLSDRTSRADRVVYWRDLPGRLERLYPFATFDTPRAVVEGGRLVWVADGYLASARFPLARRLRWRGEDVNYISAPYVATVDAASGQTGLYLRGPAQPAFASSVARAEGVEVSPPESLETPVREHLTYPLGLFAAQAAMLARLGEGGTRWALATRDTGAASSPDAATLRPTAAILNLDGTGERLWWTAPLGDAAGSRLTAIVAAGADESGRGRLLLLRVEGATVLPTPAAAASRLSVAPAYLAPTAGQGPASARRGPVLVVPAAGTVAYLQTLFEAPRSGEPRRYSVEAVAVLAGGRIGIGTDGLLAARALFRGDGGAPVAGLESALSEARAAFLALDSARQAGDWERFGRAWAALKRALRADSGRP